MVARYALASNMTLTQAFIWCRGDCNSRMLLHAMACLIMDPRSLDGVETRAVSVSGTMYRLRSEQGPAAMRAAFHLARHG